MLIVFVYFWGFRAHQNLRSLVPIMNDDDGQMIFGEPWGHKASWYLSYRWGKPPKNLTQETCPDRGSNPGPLRDRRAYCCLPHSGGLGYQLTGDLMLHMVSHLPPTVGIPSLSHKESIWVQTNIYVWNFRYRTIMYLWMCCWVSFSYMQVWVGGRRKNTWRPFSVSFESTYANKFTSTLWLLVWT